LVTALLWLFRALLHLALALLLQHLVLLLNLPLLQLLPLLQHLLLQLLPLRPPPGPWWQLLLLSRAGRPAHSSRGVRSGARQGC
jgi:hypothetical protein